MTTEAAVFKEYEQLNLWRCPTCQSCRSENCDLEGPISIWQVGRLWAHDTARILFVGKTARGQLDTGEKILPHRKKRGFIDATGYADRAIEEDGFAYWRYTRDILGKLYGNWRYGWDRIALTNLIKCNVSMGVDLTTPLIATNCAQGLGVFRHEVQRLQPNHIVAYLGTWYDEYLEASLGGLGQQVWSAKGPISNGRKVIHVAEYGYARPSKPLLRVLRTSHPERQNKEGFTNLVVRWIRSRRDGSVLVMSR